MLLLNVLDPCELLHRSSLEVSDLLDILNLYGHFSQVIEIENPSELTILTLMHCNTGHTNPMFTTLEQSKNQSNHVHRRINLHHNRLYYFLVTVQ